MEEFNKICSDAEEFDRLSSCSDEPSKTKEETADKKKFEEYDITAFLKYFTDPLSCDELREAVDSITPEDLGYDRFDQKLIMKGLTQDAHSQGISPSQLFKDIKTLIFSDQKFKHVKISSDIAKNIQVLKKRYNVSETITAPDSVTMSRLEIMFPQYTCMIANELLSYRLSKKLASLFVVQTPPTSMNYCYRCTTALNAQKYCSKCRVYCTLKPQVITPDILNLPDCMKVIAFASAIPSAAVEGLKEDDRQKIIVAHLIYQIFMTYNVKEQNEILNPVYPIQIIVMDQIKNSLLSDACRLRLLQNMAIIDASGVLIPCVVHCIKYYKTNFPTIYSKIIWDIMGFKEPVTQ